MFGRTYYIGMFTAHQMYIIVNVSFLLACLGLRKQLLSEPS